MIKIQNVSKIFNRNGKTITAVDNLNLEIQDGQIFGLLGSNGAGKTTTLRMIASTLSPSKGSISVEGYDTVSQAEDVRKNLGILFGGDTGLYDRLTARENIMYFAELNNLSKQDAEKQLEQLADAFNLHSYLDRRTGGFSRGMKQKTSFARSIIHNPKVMLFDEPSAGLDVIASEEVIDFIKLCKKNGKTIVLSSHDMAEVEQLCDTVAIINRGHILAQGTIPSLLEKYNKQNIKSLFMDLVKQDDLCDGD